MGEADRAVYLVGDLRHLAGGLAGTDLGCATADVAEGCPGATAGNRALDGDR